MGSSGITLAVSPSLRFPKSLPIETLAYMIDECTHLGQRIDFFMNSISFKQVFFLHLLNKDSRWELLRPKLRLLDRPIQAKG
jgi:hypothetical protein